MSSGKKSKGGKDRFDDARKDLGNATETLIQINEANPSFLQQTGGQRAAFGQQLGLPSSSLDTLRTGGFTPFNRDDLASISAIRGLSPSDPALGQAQNLFQNNAGVNALQGINIGQQQRGAQGPLRSFNSGSLRATKFGDLRNFRPNAQRGVDFSALQNFDPSAQQGVNFQGLQNTASGNFLDVGNNPFLQQAIANAQRVTSQNFTNNVQPGLAAQFGGGFGLTGSASQNTQRRAVEDLNRSLAEQATSTLANQFNIQQGFQQQAQGTLGQLQLGQAQGIDQSNLSRASQLGQLGLSKAQGIDQSLFNRASQLGQLGLSRAGQIDSNSLARAQGLGQLGLGFTQAGIQRGSALGGLQNQQAQGLLGVGQARRGQELQQAQALSSIGQAQRTQQQQAFNVAQQQFNAPFDQQAQRLGTISSILGSGGTIPGQAGTQRNQVLGGLGGALTGGLTGFAAGGPIGAGVGALGGGILGVL